MTWLLMYIIVQFMLELKFYITMAISQIMPEFTCTPSLLLTPELPILLLADKKKYNISSSSTN